MNNRINLQWGQWAGFAAILVIVAGLAAGATYWYTSAHRSAARPNQGIGSMNHPELGNLRESLDQLRQLQSEMGRMVSPHLDSENLAPSSLFQPPEQMLAQMEQLFHQLDRATHPVDPAGTFDKGWNFLAISPSINMRPEKDRLVLTVTLPQTDKKDIALTLNGDVLKISAERHSQGSSAASNTRSAHHASARFEQQIRLPAIPADPGRIEATFEDNVLRVIIPLPGLNPPQETQVPIR